MTDSLKMVQIAYKALDEKKAEDITVIDISHLTSITDYFIITNGTSQPHMASLVDEVSKQLDKAGYSSKTVEGGRASTWTLLVLFSSKSLPSFNNLLIMSFRKMYSPKFSSHMTSS